MRPRLDLDRGCPLVVVTFPGPIAGIALRVLSANSPEWC